MTLTKGVLESGSPVESTSLVLPGMAVLSEDDAMLPATDAARRER